MSKANCRIFVNSILAYETWFDEPPRLYTGEPMPKELKPGDILHLRAEGVFSEGTLDERPQDLIEGSGRLGEPKTLTSSLRQRPGDQPLPTPNDLPHIHDLVIEDIKQRKALGVGRYGTPLQPFNDRDALRDAYEEILDAAAYLRQLIEERDNAE